jgi:hypothetical protein
MLVAAQSERVTSSTRCGNLKRMGNCTRMPGYTCQILETRFSKCRFLRKVGTPKTTLFQKVFLSLSFSHFFSKSREIWKIEFCPHVTHFWILIVNQASGSSFFLGKKNYSGYIPTITTCLMQLPAYSSSETWKQIL